MLEQGAEVERQLISQSEVQQSTRLTKSMSSKPSIEDSSQAHHKLNVNTEGRAVSPPQTGDVLMFVQKKDRSGEVSYEACGFPDCTLDERSVTEISFNWSGVSMPACIMGKVVRIVTLGDSDQNT